MDQKVLDAQQWVNATYGAVQGYHRCEETGRTGWDTMFSLTHGLQHELGIQTLSTNFGPTTLSLLTQMGDVKPGFPNTNIIRIVQHALFCKGYWGGDILGVFDGRTTASVRELKTDAGVDASNGDVWPKLFKALLTMDAYVLLAGGSPDVRAIQQWLNANYTGKSSFSIIPCDGHYSRDVQTALMKAIQYAVGVPADQATGNFGPATQSGLRANVLSRGSSGIFVQLFSAACVFNGQVNGYHTTFKSTYDNLIEAYVKAFQTFSALEPNGRGDYPTWAQLLVSCGDPDRPVDGSDTRFEITPGRAAALRAAGYRYVGRYLDEDADSTLDKEIKPGELDVIFNAGLRVFPISQYNARDVSDFSWDRGYQDARRAHARAEGLGFNRGTVIYFAVDYDAIDEEITSNIVPYFHGVQAGLASLGKRYVAGVYGSRNVCSRATDEAYACYSFVSGMSWGFSGNLGFPMPRNWSFTQCQEIRFAAGSDVIDLDRDAHRPGTDPGVGRDGVGGGQSPAAEFLDHVDQLYATSQVYGAGDHNRRVVEYLRYPDYVTLYSGWDVLIGDVDRDWIAFASRYLADHQHSTVVAGFQDPFYGVSIGTAHLGATANAVYLKGSGGVGSANRGDFGGWGGDLSTFYAEWQHNAESYASGLTFCRDRLAKIGVSSSFGFDDLVEDVDGYLIGTALTAGARVDQALRVHLEGNGHLTRFQRYFQQRYGGTQDGVKSTALAMLCDPFMNDHDLFLLREAAIQKQGAGVFPPTVLLPTGKLGPFLDGYAEVITNLATS